MGSPLADSAGTMPEAPGFHFGTLGVRSTLPHSFVSCRSQHASGTLQARRPRPREKNVVHKNELRLQAGRTLSGAHRKGHGLVLLP